MERLPEDGWLARADAPATLRAAQEREDEPCPVVTLPAEVEGLAATLAPRVARNIRQGRHRLGADARVPAARWNAKGEPGVLLDERVRAFHHDAACALAA